MFATRYGDVFKGDAHWQKIGGSDEKTYDWPETSTYVTNPPYFEDIQMEPAPVTDIKEARVLGLFQDSIPTDHISPAGAIKADGPAGSYLVEHQVRPVEFNSFGARRGNHHVMMRGTFGNVRIKNQMMPGIEGGVTIHHPSGDESSIYDVAMRYKREGVPAHAVAGSAALCADAQLLHREHFVHLPHPTHGTTMVEGSRFKLSRTPASVEGPAPTYGCDNQYVLETILGYDADRVTELVIAGALE